MSRSNWNSEMLAVRRGETGVPGEKPLGASGDEEE